MFENNELILDINLLTNYETYELKLNLKNIYNNIQIALYKIKITKQNNQHGGTAIH